MRRLFFIIAALFLIVPLAACEEGVIAPPPGQAKTDLPRLTLSADNIVYWSKLPDGIGIQLTDRGAAELMQLSRDNQGKQIAIFVGQIWSAAPIVQEPITDGRVFIGADNQDPEKLQKTLDALPASRRR